ncbi:MAG TPA: GNAT family N-acetyltransferase [Pirellulales bacterium]|nr:GNAT family N-acetyltransferase [Pirellulales bacterium]
MGLTYFKRFRMEIDLRGRDFSAPPLPVGYHFVPWASSRLEAHAEAKYHSFRDEIDSNVFPCLGDFAGCLRLMEEIAAKPGFLPEATWLVAHTDDDVRFDGQIDFSRMNHVSVAGICETDTNDGYGASSRNVVPIRRDNLRLLNGNSNTAMHYCGTVQGVFDRSGMGAIQNLGVVPEYRGLGLGTALMQQALAGFQKAGIKRAFLEVTAQNSGAVRLYKQLGFARSRTVYKVSEVAYA